MKYPFVLRKMCKNVLTIAFFILVCFPIQAQLTEKYTSPYKLFEDAEELYHQEQYASARISYRKFIDNFSDQHHPYYLKALYHEGLAALALYNNDAIKLLENFNKNYPESIYKHNIYYKIGMYYFQKKDYKTCVNWLSKLRKFDLEPNDKDACFYKLGESYFQLGDFEKARNAFYEVKDGNSTYAPASLYYYSHIAYQNQSYQAALGGFEKLLSIPEFRKVAQVYIIQIYYRLNRYEDVVINGAQFIDSIDGSKRLETIHLIGDSYYELKKYDEAVVYLAKYNKEAKTTRQDDYQLAFAYFKSGNYDDAIWYFDKVSNVKDTLGQIAYYHIAESYLKKGENAFARTAFEQASFISIDEKIQEDALYNYAILSYKLDVNPFDEAIEALELYLKKYPNSDRKKEVYEYLLNVYTQTNNYDLALQSIEKIEEKDLRLKGAYQIIAYNKSISLFQKGNFDKALKAFDAVKTYNINDKLSNDALYWKAETFYKLKKLPDAISTFKAYISSPGTALDNKRKDAFYNVAFAYFDQNKVNDAIEYFRLYLQENRFEEKEQKADVLLHLGELYYTSKQNDLAIEYFKACIDYNYLFQDKALYYLAKTYGYKNNSDLKISTLLDIVNNYPKSKYLVASIYETGLSYRYKNMDEKAVSYFEQILKDHPSSPFVKESRVELADVYFKNKDYAKAEQSFRKLIADYPDNKTICSKCVRGIVEIYKAQKKTEKIDELVTEYPCANLSQDDQEDIYYNAALEPYLDSAFQEAIPEIQKYLDKFPNGKYKLELTAYKANAYYRSKDELKAIELYQTLLNEKVTDFTEIAAIRVSKYYYNTNNYTEALKYYLLLEKISTKPDVINNTEIGIMRCAYLTGDYQKAIQGVNKLNAYAKTNPTIQLEMEFVKGMCSFKLDDIEQAKKSLAWVYKNTTTVFAAEAKYHLALIASNEKNTAETELHVKELIKMKPVYEYWVAKALLLQSSLLIAKNELFQAEYTLKSIITNYENEDDGILLEANERWDELMQIKNKPKDIKEQPATVIEIKENGK